MKLELDIDKEKYKELIQKKAELEIDKEEIHKHELYQEYDELNKEYKDTQNDLWSLESDISIFAWNHKVLSHNLIDLLEYIIKIILPALGIVGSVLIFIKLTNLIMLIPVAVFILILKYTSASISKKNWSLKRNKEYINLNNKKEELSKEKEKLFEKLNNSKYSEIAEKTNNIIDREIRLDNEFEKLKRKINEDIEKIRKIGYQKIDDVLKLEKQNTYQEIEQDIQDAKQKVKKL